MQLNNLSQLLLVCLLIFVAASVPAQNIPNEYHFSADGRQLTAGDRLADGLYDRQVVREVHIDFPQTDYWNQLTQNYSSETEIPASLTIDGITYDSVGVRFRGNTSYQQTNGSQKKSFAIATDFVHEDQRIMGYNNLKFNNGHQDATFMREVLYCRMAKKYMPIAKANYVHLFLNNQDWGVYPNIQSVDKNYLEDWFMSNDGARFRATVEGSGGGPGGGGPGWGDGTAGMNYLGTDTAKYQKYYDLKSSDIDDPWSRLIEACQVLSTASANNMDEVNQKLDIDKILWYLAAENIFADDDSYVMKGKMDYYVYYEPETDRTLALEYDGNSAFLAEAANSTNWGPFKNVTNVNYPLLNKLLNIPQWRQRYLAHYRTIVQETFTTANATAIIDSMDAQIKTLVASDTKKLYTTNQYTSGVTALKSFVTTRRNFLLSNAEVAQQGPNILSASWFNKDLVQYGPNYAGEEVYVKANLGSPATIQKVNLYYSPAVIGLFTKTEMFDDGLHQDDAAADGIYGGSITGFPANTLVRYYIEAISSNATFSATYFPAGAEHDVFVYEVKASQSVNGVVINELMASNKTGATDESGDHADWIELYNTNPTSVDLSGFYLSDDAADLTKFTLPDGTTIGGNDYLIIWADDEEIEGPLHASFKLAIEGESIVLSNPSQQIVDQVDFGQQIEDVAYARVPNGTGPFVQQAPTFNDNNDLASGTQDSPSSSSFLVYPNPFSDQLVIESDAATITAYSIFDPLGRVVLRGDVNAKTTVNLSNLAPGSYFIKIENAIFHLVKL